MPKWLPLANCLNTHCRKLQVAGYSNKMKRTNLACPQTLSRWSCGLTTDIPWSHCKRSADSLQMFHGFAKYDLWLAVWAFTESWITVEFCRFP